MVLSRNCVLDVTASDDGWLYYSTISAIYRARLDDLLRLSEQTVLSEGSFSALAGNHPNLYKQFTDESHMELGKNSGASSLVLSSHCGANLP